MKNLIKLGYIIITSNHVHFKKKRKKAIMYILTYITLVQIFQFMLGVNPEKLILESHIKGKN